ncbi:hypothetical protein ACFL54_01235 [Planctomycetota bacterium]
MMAIRSARIPVNTSPVRDAMGIVLRTAIAHAKTRNVRAAKVIAVQNANARAKTRNAMVARENAHRLAAVNAGRAVLASANGEVLVVVNNIYYTH